MMNPSMSSSSSSSDGLFSPTYGRRSSLANDLLTPTPEQLPQQRQQNQPAEDDDDDGTTPLPRLKDTSWIGARVSPIPQTNDYDDDDEEDDDEDIAIMAPYHKALGLHQNQQHQQHQPFQSQQVHEASFIGLDSSSTTEQTTLFGRKMVSNKQTQSGRMLGYRSGGNQNNQSEQQQTIKSTTTTSIFFLWWWLSYTIRKY